MSIVLWAARLEHPLTEAETRFLFLRLPESRRERLLRVKNRAAWREPLCAYALLAYALKQQEQIGALPTIQVTEKGKPFFPTVPAVHFNLSHTEGAVLVGVSEAPVGVDIQGRRAVTPRTARRIAEAGLSAEQYFTKWARYEAISKRKGSGIAVLPLEQWDSEDAVSLDLFPGYAAAVSGQEPILSVHKVSQSVLCRAD